MKFSKLYIWGANPFNNRLLASHVESFAGIPAQCINFEKNFCGELFNQNCMVFCDCDKVDALSYCKTLRRPEYCAEHAVGIVLMNVHPELDLLKEVQTYSIHGIFYCNDNFDLIGKGIQKVLQGEHWLSRGLLVRSLEAVRSEYHERKTGVLPSSLTFREQEILKLIAAGDDNQTIADKLFISANTVKTHVTNIYKKIEATNRVQAILWASKNPGQLIPVTKKASKAVSSSSCFIGYEGEESIR